MTKAKRTDEFSHKRISKACSSEPGAGWSWPESLSQILRTEYSLDEIVQSTDLEGHLNSIMRSATNNMPLWDDGLWVEGGKSPVCRFKWLCKHTLLIHQA